MAGTPHGNAQWANRDSLYQSGFDFTESDAFRAPSEEYILGKWIDQPEGEPHPMHLALYNGVRYSSGERYPTYLSIAGDGHIMTVAPTCSGKGVGLIIPNLLNYKKSVIVIDPKGENYEKTYKYREYELCQDIWCFDPFKVKSNQKMNGIAILKKAKKLFDLWGTNQEEKAYSFFAEVSRIAEAIVVRKRDEKDPFFNTAAQIMIKDAIILTMYLYQEMDIPPLSAIRSFFLKEIETNRIIEQLDEKIALSDEKLNYKDVLVHDAACELKQYRENRDVLTTVLLQTEFLEDKNVAAIVDADKTKCLYVLDPEILNSNVLSVYLIIPPQHLTRQSRFLRLFITTCIDAITTRNTDHDKLESYPNVLFILDEIAQLGTLDCIQKAAALGAGYKMTLWMFWQDLSQLKGLYPEDWMTFLSNAKIQQFFGCNDLETAKYISERCGPRTKSTYSHNNQYSTHGWHTDVTEGHTTSKIAGELIRPSEVLRADNTIIFHFCQGNFPFMCERIKYFEDEPFVERIDQ